MRSHHNNINVELSYSQNQPSRGEPAPVAEDGCHVRCPKSDSRTTLRNVMCCDDTHLTLAAILSLVHALVEITLMIRFICLLEQSGNVSAQVTLLTETAITNNFIFAFTGLLSSWIFLTRSRSNFSKELPELK
ncbi:hypothetical protein Pst134EA_009563 [Puccinia striiformis f. sp. tritici]|nr:hypothetical protein Pst134EA_009563 [Puccinia striiformis f. sp. tritici]KAH9469041.1 hypothetical protein Pst134EA_009563 [Puccinia striiformis f. sp. tritici]